MTQLRWRDHRVARAELRDAAICYDDQEPGLGSRLLDEVAEAVAFVREWPTAAPPYRDGQDQPLLRRMLTETFPYGVIYFVRDDEVIIVAYARERRHPGYWRRRLAKL